MEWNKCAGTENKSTTFSEENFQRKIKLFYESSKWKKLLDKRKSKSFSILV